jgi:TolB-like protein/Tfp pilus assembly protein PilF
MSAVWWAKGHNLLFLFDNFVLDTKRRELRRNGELVVLQPQVFDLLEYVIRHRDRVVSRDDLIEAIWKGRIVSISTLATRINAMRVAIGDTGQDQRLIRTLQRRGLRFVGSAREEALSEADQATATVSLSRVQDRPSIAVLPFTNMSGDPEQEYFADGMVEDIINALSRFKSLFVIARNSTFTYKGRPVDIKQVGRELGVGYVLEGSVRKANNRIRITGQLIEAESNRPIWADRFEGALEDVFDLQDLITIRVVGFIAPKVELAEIERARDKPTNKMDSYDFYLRGAASFYQRDPVLEALKYFKLAIERDAAFGAAYAMAAFMLQRHQADSGCPLSEEMRVEAISLARQGARLANEDAFTLARCGHVLTYLAHEYDRGSALVEQAVALNPNLAVAWYSRGWVSLMSDQFECAIESFERMISLSPLDPLQAHTLAGISLALFNLERYEEGWVSAQKATQLTVNVHTLTACIINSARSGRGEEAQMAVDQLLKLHPLFRPPGVQQIFPIRSVRARNKVAAALRDAGLSE